MSKKLTQWFGGNLRPFRRGVYERHFGGRGNIGYALYDGERWMHRAYTPSDAAAERQPSGMSVKWRGLAEKP